MVDMYRTLDSIPVLAKAGGILVMTDEIRGTEAEKNPESLNIRVFPGADGSFRLYEDDNETCAYENGACVFTEMDYKEKDQGVFTIHPAQGKTELIPAKRAYTVEFCNFAKTGTDTVKVLVNGAETEAAVKYEEKLQKICVDTEPDDDLKYKIINNRTNGYCDKFQSEVAENLSEDSLTDNDCCQSDNNGTTAHVDIGESLILSQQCTGKSNQSVRDHKAKYPVKIRVDSLCSCHFVITSGCT